MVSAQLAAIEHFQSDATQSDGNRSIPLSHNKLKPSTHSEAADTRLATVGQAD